MGMCEACLVSMEWACLLCTDDAEFPIRAELCVFIQSSQVLAPIPFPVSALWGC